MRNMGPIWVSAVLLFMFAEYDTASAISSECDMNQTIHSCENIHTSMGFTYHVPNNVKMHLTKDCEHGWYYLNGTFIADSTDNTKSGFVKNLTISTCENLIWESKCAYNAVPTCISFSILEQSKSTNDSQTGNKTCSEDCNHKKVLNVLPPSMIALIVIVIVIVIVIMVGGFVAVWKYCRHRGKGSNGVV